MFWTEFCAVAWKTALIYFLLVGLTRLVGQKLLARATFFDFVIGITIGSMGGAYVVTSTPGYFVLFSPAILTFLVLATGFFAMKSRRFRAIIEGKPEVLIHEGAIQYHSLRRARYHLDNLQSDLRIRGIFDISHVERAILEPNGRLSVVEKGAYRSLTPGDFGLEGSAGGRAIDLIKDGEVLEKNLSSKNLDRNWLRRQLSARGIDDESKVFLASLNANGILFLDIKDQSDMIIGRVEP